MAGGCSRLEKMMKLTKMEAAAEAAENNLLVLDNVHQLLKCPLCTTSLSPPIYQCRNGHTSCSKCKTRLKSCCAECGMEMGSIRCLALEKLAEALKVPSKQTYKEATLKLAELHIKN